MAFYENLVLGIVVLCLSLELGWSMKCYSCSSLDDEKCGTTWGYEADSTMYLEECMGEKVACKKLEYDNEMHGGMVVTRSCWNTTDLLHEFEMECDSFRHGTSCYCQGENDQACNGGQLLHSHNILTAVLTGLSFLLATVMYMK